MEPNVRARLLVVVGVLFATAACADNIVAPLSKTALLRRDLSSVGRLGPTRFANSIKYRDKGKKNARGFAGTSSLEARALLGMDGNTTLDIATGTIDNPDVSRLLSKIQIKQFAPNGSLQTTTNFKNLSSSTYQATLGGRVHGSKLGVQGTVIGVDGRHTDVVSATETVKFRPDISVDRILAPTRSPIGTPTQITAVISEINGDVGARADCVLAVDGVDVGRGNGIWIDAGRSVSCVFEQIFNSTGTKQLAVRAISVNPGDWSTANNSTTQAITVYVPNEFSWYGWYNSLRDYVGTRLSEGFYIQIDNGARTDYHQYQILRRGQGWQSMISGNAPLMAGPLTFSLHDEIDGHVLTDFEFDPATAIVQNFSGTYEDPDFGTITYSAECVNQVRLVPFYIEEALYFGVPAGVFACSEIHNSATGVVRAFTDFQYGTSAGDVSYYTEHSQQYDDGDPDLHFDSTYTFNGDVEYTYGNQTFGNDYSFVLSISGPNETRVASGAIHATTHSFVFSYPYTCEDFTNDTFTGRSCIAGDWTETNTYGEAYGNPP